jgi:5-methylcytosine-specific restriction endonuclease McrA
MPGCGRTGIARVLKRSCPPYLYTRQINFLKSFKMAIPHKKGTCIDCGPHSAPRYLMAQRCITDDYHYQKHQEAKYRKKQQEKLKVKTAAVAGRNNGLTLGKWFNMKISMMPGHCENCDDYLNPYAPWSARAYVAHIVPKRHFESVMVHPLNCLFLCIDCHTKFDNSLSREVVQMACWPLAVSRFNGFKSEITEQELKHLQPCLQKLY